MNQATIEQNQLPCDKCEGDGKIFSHDAYLFFRHWRLKIGAPQWKVAAVLRFDVSQMSKFEKGRLVFGESRLRKLAEILMSWDKKL